jgi:hypothetical protein
MSMANGRLRKLFKTEELENALDVYPDLTVAAGYLTDLGRGVVSRQLLRYWQQHLEFKKRNGEPYIGTTVLDRSIQSGLTLRVPSATDDMALVGKNECNDRLLIIPDLHAPYHHPDALEFLAAVAGRYQPTRAINLGDETDGHALSMHDSDPNLDSAGAELSKARAFLRSLAGMFPCMDICHSNHGSLIYRRAFKSGIPVEYIKSYREILFPDGGGAGWEWSDNVRLDLPNGQVAQFQHQCVGDYLQNAAHERCNLIIGHEHGKYEITYKASKAALYFGMYSGCLIDPAAMAFAYGKLFPKKPIIGCSVIIDSQPMLVPMLLDSNGRWVGRL